MLLWQWLLVFGIPTFAVITGLLLGNFLTSDRKKTTTKRPFMWSRRTRANKEGKPCISFQQFLDMYSIKPEKWDTFYDCKVRYETTSYKPCVGWVKEELYWETLKDQRLYIRWKEKKELQYTLIESAKTKQTVLEDVQIDIQNKMRAIEIQRKKEFQRIEEERQKNNAEYDQLMKKITGFINTPLYTPAGITTKEEIEKGTATIAVQTAPSAVAHIPIPTSFENGRPYYMGKPISFFADDQGQFYTVDENGNIKKVKVVRGTL